MQPNINFRLVKLEDDLDIHREVSMVGWFGRSYAYSIVVLTCFKYQIIVCDHLNVSKCYLYKCEYGTAWYRWFFAYDRSTKRFFHLFLLHCLQITIDIKCVRLMHGAFEYIQIYFFLWFFHAADTLNTCLPVWAQNMGKTKISKYRFPKTVLKNRCNFFQVILLMKMSFLIPKSTV